MFHADYYEPSALAYRQAERGHMDRMCDGRADDYDDAGKHYRPCGPECLFDHVRPDGRCRWTGQGVAS